MARWSTRDAKQRLSEVIRRSADEPQEIFNRGRRVAAVISDQDLTAFEEWREGQRQATLASVFSEVRELAARDDYELEIGARVDREIWRHDDDAAPDEA